MEENASEKASLAGGCFWCTEAVFKRLEGVELVRPGFIGGTIKNPAYREVITGRTGHAEAVQIFFNPQVISFRELLLVFFATHDPTTLNRQQNDVGTQYRSAIFYHSEEQRRTSQKVVSQLEAQEVFSGKIVTEITPATAFFPAEEEHLNYYDLHPEQSYCQFIIDPKIEKLKNQFSGKLKDKV